jgi:type II secretory pathway pseudopilin PulG
MLAARRTVLTPSDREAINCSDLQYSALMAWIKGKTWNDILFRADTGGAVYGRDVALRLSSRFLDVMAALEREGVAHTDISPGNVIVDLERNDVQLVDLEDLYVPGVPKPKTQNTGTQGYRHPSADSDQKTTWCAEGDRYSTAVMAAEMLLLSNPVLRAEERDNGFFGGSRTNAASMQRFNANFTFLQSIAPEFAALFKTAWMSPTLDACPRISELREALLKTPIPQAPQAHVAIPGVTWNPLVPTLGVKAPPPPRFTPTPPVKPPVPTSAPLAGVWSTTPVPAKVTPSAPPLSYATKPASGAKQPLGPGAWTLIILAILVVVGIIIAMVVSSSSSSTQQSQEQRQQDAAAQQQAQQAEEQRLRDEATLKPSDEASPAAFDQWLERRKSRMGAQSITMTIENKCTSEPIYVAVEFKVPDDSNRWVTTGWTVVKSGQTVDPVVVTNNSNIYYYAYSGDPYTWDGSSSKGSISARVVDNAFVHVDGSTLRGRNPRNVSMRPVVFNSWGQHNLPLTCATD